MNIEYGYVVYKSDGSPVLETWAATKEASFTKYVVLVGTGESWHDLYVRQGVRAYRSVRTVARTTED